LPIALAKLVNRVLSAHDGMGMVGAALTALDRKTPPVQATSPILSNECFWQLICKYVANGQGKMGTGRVLLAESMNVFGQVAAIVSPRIPTIPLGS